MKYVRITSHRITYLDNDGNPYVGAKLYTCTPLTTTLAASYNSRPPFGAGNLNANPIILDSRGQAVVYANTALKLILCTPTSTGPTDGVIQTDDYLQEQIETVSDRAVADPGTSNNQYTASVSPAYTTLLDGFSLAFIPDGTNTDTIVSQAHTGTGIDDGRFTGPFVGSTPGSIFTVQIDGVEFHGAGLSDVTWGGTPLLGHVYTVIISTAAGTDKFKYRKDGGAWSAEISITGAAQSLVDGVTITFAATTGHTATDYWNNINTFKWKKDGGAWTEGVAINAALQILLEGIGITFAQKLAHTLNDIWAVTVNTPAKLNFCSLGNWIIYKNVGGQLKASDGGDIQANIPAHLDAVPSQSCWIHLNPGLPVLTTLKPYRERINLVTTYTVLDADIGKEISCVGTFALTWPACATLANHWWWVRNSGSGTITLTANGTEKFKYSGLTAGASTLPLYPGQMVLIVTNGVDLHVAGYITGGFVKKTYLTSGTSFTTQDVSRSIFLQMGGGGGGGGGAVDGGLGPPPALTVGGGGGSGGYAEKVFNVSPSTAYTYAIGAAGAAGANTGLDGGAGGNTTFTVGATTVTANGGTGGEGSVGAASATLSLGGAGAVISTNGDFNLTGVNGDYGIITTTDPVGGKGGDSRFGAGGIAGTDATGAAATGYGGGGGGASKVGTATVGNAGGAGTAGKIIVTEYS